MGVFWFGIKEKIKNSISKKYVDDNFLSKTNPDLQLVNSKIDFKDNIVAKREAFVDIVGNGATNIPNLDYLKKQDTLGVFRLYIHDFNDGRWNIEWIKKPILWNDNDIAIDEIHVNTTKLENNVLSFTTQNGFQGWNNVRIPATAATNQLNNAIFKDLNKPTFLYVFMRLNSKLGSRILKRVIPTSFGFEKQYLELEFSVNLILPTTKIVLPKPQEPEKTFFPKETK